MQNKFFYPGLQKSYQSQHQAQNPGACDLQLVWMQMKPPRSTATLASETCECEASNIQGTGPEEVTAKGKKERHPAVTGA